MLASKPRHAQPTKPQASRAYKGSCYSGPPRSSHGSSTHAKARVVPDPLFSQRPPRRVTCRSRGRAALRVDASLLSAVTTALTDAGHAYSDLLNAKPLPVKSVTSGLIYGVGDVLAQLPPWRASTKGKALDRQRLRNFMMLGVGTGFIWALYYDWLELQLDLFNLGEEGAVKVLASSAVTQLAWTPIFFAFWTLPVNAYLNGKRGSEIVDTLKEAWGPLVISNWKVWPFADLVIFNLPVQWRVLTANMFDIIWATIESDQVTDIKDASAPTDPAADQSSSSTSQPQREATVEK